MKMWKCFSNLFLRYIGRQGRENKYNGSMVKLWMRANHNLIYHARNQNGGHAGIQKELLLKGCLHEPDNPVNRGE